MSRPLLAATLVCTVALNAKAADELADDQLGPFQASGMINADNVYARSYAAEADYAVAKLNTGDPVVVVGNRGDWLKILPPPGVFCLVGRAWIEVRGDGSVGRVRDGAGSVNVRIGSAVLPPPYTKIVSAVQPGQDVRIVGQDESFFKVAPPAGAFAYVHRRFVNPVKRVEVVSERGQYVVKGNGAALPPMPDNGTPKPNENGLVNVPENATTPSDSTQPPANPTTGPSDLAGATPTTRPAVTAAPPAFSALEARFMAASKLPLGEQPIDELAAGYERTLAANPDDSTKAVADYRLAGLRLRKEAVETLKAVDAQRKQREAAQAPLAAEAAEITARMSANAFKRYTAVGTVRASTLPNNGKTLYRLTDPASGRTVVYLGDGADVANMDGQFVGVRGTVADDASRQIKLLTPQTVEPVDPADIAKGTVSSGMTPPSLIATGSD